MLRLASMQLRRHHGVGRPHVGATGRGSRREELRLLRSHGAQFAVIPLAGGACPSRRAAPTWTPPPTSCRSAPAPRALLRLGLTSWSSAPQPIQPHHPAIAEIIVVLADLDAAANCAAHLLSHDHGTGTPSLRFHWSAFAEIDVLDAYSDLGCAPRPHDVAGLGDALDVARRPRRSRCLRPAAYRRRVRRTQPPGQGLDPATAKVDAKCIHLHQVNTVKLGPARPHSPETGSRPARSRCPWPPIAPGPSSSVTNARDQPGSPRSGARWTR